MNDSQMLKELAMTDAYAPHTPLPVSARTRDTALAEIERRTDMQTQKNIEPQASPRRRRNGWLVAAAAFIVVLVVGTAMAFLASRTDDSVIAPVTTTTSAISTTVATVPVLPAPPLVDAWQRVGAGVMDPVVGLLDITVADSRLVALGFDPGADYRQDGVVFVSENGVDWTRLAADDPALTTGTVLIFGVAAGGPGLVAGGMSCEDAEFPCLAGPYPTAWTSTDGTAWTRTVVEQGVDFGAINDVLVTDHGIIAVGGFAEPTPEGGTTSSGVVWLSTDGTDWSRVWQGAGVPVAEFGSGPGPEVLALGPDGLIVGAGWAFNESGEGVAAVWVSSNAVDWTRVDPESVEFTSDTGHDAIISDIVWGPAGFVAIGGDGSRAAVWTSTDGLAWTRIDTTQAPIGSEAPLSAIAALDGGYVAAGPNGFADFDVWAESPVTVWTSMDGISWDRVQVLGSGNVRAIVSTDGGIAIAGQLPADNDYHAAVWMGPTFDPEAPPPEPPMPQSVWEEGESPSVDPATIEGADVGSGDPHVTSPGDDYATLESGEARLPLGQITDLPDSTRLDFLASRCDETSCFREPVFVDPNDDQSGDPYWVADTPFHVRHGFVNETDDPLGGDFDVVLYVTRQEGPELTSGIFDIGQTYRFDSDYVVQGTTTKCGPGYWEQAEAQTCEWFVHDFAEGLPAGRYDIWTGWYAPCSAWQDFGLVDACDNPDDVTWEFSSAVNSPWLGDDYTEGLQPPFDPEAILAETSPFTRGWPEG
jgi:hypothetical protein